MAGLPEVPPGEAGDWARPAMEVQGGDGVTLRETYIAAMDGIEGLKLVVTRHYPRGIASTHFDRWLPALAPSRDLLENWRRGLTTWPEYVVRFREEILGSAEAVVALRHVVDLARTRDVYLICWEKEPPCHRFLLLEMAGELSGEVS